MTYVISDTHFFHENIKKYCNRPDNFEELIIERWNNIVKEDDVVIHLGDFALGRKDKTKTKREQYACILGKLNGRKFLTKGNHDRESDEFYKSCGFEDVVGYYQLNIDGYNILLNHYPLDTHESMKDELKHHIKFLKTLDSDFVIHGHTHNRIVGEKISENIGNLDNILHFNCCVEVTNYEPILLDEIYNNLLKIKEKNVLQDY